MLKTKFGKRLFSLVLVFACLFALVSCQNKGKDEAIADTDAKVKEIAAQIIWDRSAMSKVTANVSGFVNQTKYENVTVSWTSSEPDVLELSGTEAIVHRPAFDDARAIVVTEATEDEAAVKVVPVTMTAKITGVATWDGGSENVELTKEFKFTVQTLVEGLQSGTIAEIKAAAYQYIYEEQGVQKQLVSNSNVTFDAMVRGVITAKLQADGTGQFMIHDGTEGIYVYSTTDANVGDEVTVVGKIYSYYGSLQFGKDITITAVESSGIQVGAYKEVTPQEIETAGAAVDADGNLVKAGYFGGELVNVYGKLVKGAAPAGSGQYHIQDAKTGEQVWIYYKSYTAEMAAQLDALDGKYVKVRGVTYDRDSRIVKCEILWDGTIVEAEAPTLTDADLVTIALASVTAPAETREDFELASGEGYVWEIVSGSAIAIENGVAKVTCGEADETVTLKLTVTIGEATDSKEFEVLVPSAKIEIISVTEALALANAQESGYTADKYYVQGVIVNVAHNTYGNVTLSDGTSELYVYGLYSSDGTKKYGELEVKPVVGDVVTLQGVLGKYNNNPQMNSGWLHEHIKAVSFEEATTLAGTDGSYTEVKYALTGKIQNIKSDQYGNLTIENESGATFYTYGLYSADGETRYDAMEVKPVVGDTITVISVLGSYNGSPQMKDSWLISHTVATGEGEGEGETEGDPAPDAEGYIAKYDFGTTGVSGYSAGKEHSLVNSVDGAADKVVGHWTQTTTVTTEGSIHQNVGAFAVLCATRKNNATKDAYLEFSFSGTVSSISFDATWWSESDSKNASNIAKFEVQYSVDGETWTSVDFGGLSKLDASKYTTIECALVNAKYVRIYLEGTEANLESNVNARIAVDNVKFK